MTHLQVKPINIGDQPLNLERAFIRRTTLDRANLVGANLTRADMTGASARGADFRDAKLKKTILHGADLTDAKNLTIAQLAEALINDETRLPDYIDRGAVKRRQHAQSGKLL